MSDIQIWTDGSCKRNPGGPGGWAAVLIDKHGTKIEISGYHPDPTTNNRMEITAAVEALKFVGSEPLKIVIRTDSTYLINGATTWMRAWKRSGFTRNAKNRGRISIPNADLWREIDRHQSIHSVRWEYVKAHAKNEHNNRCDELAGNAWRKSVPFHSSSPVYCRPFHASTATSAVEHA